jgi:carboxyl-terminal processing protease
MRGKLQKNGLVTACVIASVLLSTNLSAQTATTTAPTPPSAPSAPTAPLPVDELRNFADVFAAIKQGYVEPIEDKKLLIHAISGMLSNLDPHSAYLTDDAYKDLQVSTEGEFGGLGIEVGVEDGYVKVISPIDGTPAWKAGVMAGDVIIKLDGASVKGLSLDDAVKKMRGKPKTSIKLTIVRAGESKPIEITIVRDKIKVESVTSKLIEGGYGYVRVIQFQEDSTAELVRHLEKLYQGKPEKKSDKAGKETKAKAPEDLKGLVLDLRNDPGGLLHAAIGVSAAFLPPDVAVVSTNGRADDAKRNYTATLSDYTRRGEDPLKKLPAAAKTVPLIVLVNGGSASASEIVAGALQDHKRAVLLGTQTFGKGSVQSILPLSDTSAIKLTTARYYTPSGKSIQAKGITPDVIVEETPNGGTRERLREADLERHLEGADEAQDTKATSSADRPAKGNAKSKKSADEDSPRVGPIEYAGKNDYQFAQAMNLLKALQIIKR